jgi:hypothetical protein
MTTTLALAVIVIALLVAKRTLWRHYGPEASTDIAELRRIDRTAAVIRLASWLGGIALVFAAVYVVRPAAHGTWLDVVIGLAAGIALLVASTALAKRYGVTADAIDGAGIAILYITCWAMHVQWNVLAVRPEIIVWAELVTVLLVTAVAVILAERQGSFFVGLLGFVGACVMPALLSFDDKPDQLFVYLLALNIAVSWLGYRMRWPVLIVLSVIRTTVYEWAWVLQSFTASQLWHEAVVFAVFALVAAAPFWLRLPEKEPAESAPAEADHPTMWTLCSQRLTYVIALAMLFPLAFAFYVAMSSANTGYVEHVVVLFGYLLVIAVSLLVTAKRGGPEWLHVAGGMATLLTFLLWFRQWAREWYGPDSWPPQAQSGLVLPVSLFLALFITLYLREPGKTTWFAALLFFVFAGMAFRQPQDYITLIVAMLVILAAALPVFVRRGDRIRGATAIGLSLIAVAVLNPTSPLYMTQVMHTANPPPNPWIVLVAYAILFVALFALASSLDSPVLVIAAVAFYEVVLITSYVPAIAGLWFFAIVPYGLFIAYAFFAGERAGAALVTARAVVLASLLFFLGVSATGVVNPGITALAVAAVLLAVLWRLRRLEPVEPRFTLLMTAALVFVNAAILFVLPGPLAPIALAIEAVALIRFFAKSGYQGFLNWSVGLAVVLLLWITFQVGIYTQINAFWPDGWTMPLGVGNGHGIVRIWHTVASAVLSSALYAYLFGYAVVISLGAMFAAAYVAPREMPRLRVFYGVVGLVESWYLVNLLVANLFHSTASAWPVEFMAFTAWEDVAYTIVWAVIATGLLYVGVCRHSQAARIGATGLLILAVLKCLLHDLVQRGDPYRAASLLGLAVSMLVVGVILQRRRKTNPQITHGTNPQMTQMYAD